MVEETDFENERISNFQCQVTSTLGWAIRHTVIASLIKLYIHTKFYSNRRNFSWMDRHWGRLYYVDLVESTLKQYLSLLYVSSIMHTTETTGHYLQHYEIVTIMNMMQAGKQPSNISINFPCKFITKPRNKMLLTETSKPCVWEKWTVVNCCYVTK